MMGKLLPADNLAYQSPHQQFISWAILSLGMIVPGSLLAINPTVWTTTAILSSALGFSTFMIVIMGTVLALGGIASLFMKNKDIPYAVGIVFYIVIAVANSVALIEGTTVGVLFLAPLLIAWLYFVATQFTSQRVVERNPDGKE